ncbi:MAG: hypothetical protein JNK72_00910 [Myxococcales bacterium]|nr:hypothetical protein [Myxococcales bacterium]
MMKRAGRLGVSALLALASAWALGGCLFNDCDRCGERCTVGIAGRASESAAPLPSAPRVIVWVEAAQRAVVELRSTVSMGCGATSEISAYYGVDPASGRLVARADGPAAGSRVQTPSAEGGATATYEGLAEGLTLRVTSSWESVTLALSGGASTHTLACALRDRQPVCE